MFAQAQILLLRISGTLRAGSRFHATGRFCRSLPGVHVQEGDDPPLFHCSDNVRANGALAGSLNLWACRICALMWQVLMLFTSFGFILLHVYSGPFDNRSYLCPFPRKRLVEQPSYQ